MELDSETECRDEEESGTSESTGSSRGQRMSALIAPALECRPSIHSHSQSLYLPSLPASPCHHLRQSSTIIKNVNQTYSHLLSILERPDDLKSFSSDFIQEYSLSIEDTLTQYAVTSPTTGPDSDFGDIVDPPMQRFKYERDIRMLTRKPSIGLLPVRTYCDRCNTTVSTRVSMELPRMSV